MTRVTHAALIYLLALCYGVPVWVGRITKATKGKP